MKALSIRQPWAWLIIHKSKDIENRNWFSSFRGRFLVHAGKTMTRNDYIAAQLFISEFSNIQLPPMLDLPRGGIVGEVEMYGCVQGSDSPWFCGIYGFVLRNPKEVPFQPMIGSLGFFETNSYHGHLA